MMVDRIMSKWRQFPNIGFSNKVFALLHDAFRRILIERRVCDVNGMITKPIATSLGEMLSADPIAKKIVCTTGFGYSGSGTVLDLLSEYDNMTVLSYVDRDSSLKEVPSRNVEMDFMRQFGGVMQLEDAFKTTNVFHRDAILKCFLRMVAYLHVNVGGVFCEQFLALTRTFLDDIIEYSCKMFWRTGYEFSPHLEVLGDRGATLLWGQEASSRIYYLKDLSVPEYRSRAKDYLTAIFMRIGKKSYLVLDQLLSDYTADMEKYQQYVGPMKLIAVYRDPRDVYVTGRLKCENWIPEDPAYFVKWYQNWLQPYLQLRHQDFKLMRFEDIVFRYDDSVKEIEGFLGIDNSCCHVRKKQCFDPKKSERNIGLYKTCDNVRAVKYIQKTLPQFCI